MTLLILVSTNGLTINQHFCSGQLVEVALFFKAKQCKHEAMATTCCQKKAAKKNLASCGVNKTKKCCDEKAIVIKVDDEAQPFSIDFQDVLPVFTAIIPIQSLQIKTGIQFSTPKYFNYKPPLIVEDDIEVLVEAFLC